MTIEHEINLDRSDQGHRAWCACGYKGRLRLDVEQAFFDANDHRVRHLCRKLRRRLEYRMLPAGQQMWPWLLNHSGELHGELGGELAAIVDLVHKHLAEHIPAAPVGARRPVHRVRVAA